MTEYITYNDSYTEFLIPCTGFKVIVYNDGSGRVDNMDTNTVTVVFSNGKSDEQSDYIEDLKERCDNAEAALVMEQAQHKAIVQDLKRTIRGLDADITGQCAITDDLSTKLAEANDILASINKATSGYYVRR